MNKICFYFPYHKVSGVPVLFYRLVNELATSIELVEIFVIDYIDGAIAMNLDNRNNLKLLPFQDGVTISPPEDCILIMQAILPYSMRPELKILPNTKLFFWNLHADNLIPILIPLPGLRNYQFRNFKFYTLISHIFYKSLIKRLKHFTENAVQKKSLYFMDQPSLEKISKFLFIKNLKNVEFLPVPAIKSNHIKSNYTKENNELKFTWIGRLCDFKSHILIYTIKKMSLISFENKVKFNFFIIGEGPFKSQIAELNLNHRWFNLELLGELKTHHLDIFLLENTDILTGMGTSALEGAKLGIPTILLDVSYFELKGDYNFRWLHETKNFDLGHEITDKDILLNNNSLNDMINDVIINYSSISNKALEYFIQNHDIKNVAASFMKKINLSELKYSEIDSKLTKKNIVRQLYDFSRYY